MHIRFPSNFVYWQKIENHQKIKEKYLKLIHDDAAENYEKYQKENIWLCKLTTNYFNEPNYKIFDSYFIENVIKKSIQGCIHELQLKNPDSFNITSVWYNIYEEGQFQEVHQHSGQTGNTFSGIYLIDLEKENTTNFYQSGPRPDVNAFGFSYQSKHIPEGHVIIFPSCLEHYVNPVVGKKVSIAFNVCCNYNYL